MIQQFYSWIHMQKNWEQGLEKTPVPPCSQQHYAQQRKHRETTQAKRDTWIQQDIDTQFSLKRKQILTHATTWMNLINVYAKWNKPDTKANTTWVHLHELLRVVKSVGAENWGLPGAGGREGNGELCFNGYKVSILQDEKNSGDRWWG